MNSMMATPISVLSSMPNSISSSIPNAASIPNFMLPPPPPSTFDIKSINTPMTPKYSSQGINSKILTPKYSSQGIPSLNTNTFSHGLPLPPPPPSTKTSNFQINNVNMGNNISMNMPTSNTNNQHNRTESVHEKIAKKNLLNAIELERRNYSLQKLRLSQLHKHYFTKVSAKKEEASNFDQTVNILRVQSSNPNSPNPPSFSSSQSTISPGNEIKMLKNKLNALKNDTLHQTAKRVKDEQQLQQINKENQKLFIMIYYLKQKINHLTKTYKELCTDANNEYQINQHHLINNSTTKNNYTINNNNKKEMTASQPSSRTLLERINMNLDESDNINNLPREILSLMNDNPWFQNIVEDNRMLERHIRRLKHIIEEETRRYNFKEIILGQKSLSPTKISPTQKIQENVPKILPTLTKKIQENIPKVTKQKQKQKPKPNPKPKPKQICDYDGDGYEKKEESPIKVQSINRINIIKITDDEQKDQ